MFEGKGEKNEHFLICIYFIYTWDHRRFECCFLLFHLETATSTLSLPPARVFVIFLLDDASTHFVGLGLPGLDWTGSV